MAKREIIEITQKGNLEVILYTIDGENGFFADMPDGDTLFSDDFDIISGCIKDFFDVELA